MREADEDDILASPRPATTLTWIVALVATLAVGIAAGYLGHGSGTQPDARATATVTATVTAPTIASGGASPSLAGEPGDAVAVGDRRCGRQLGRNLELGVDIVNVGAVPVIMTGVAMTFLGNPAGLRARAVRTGTCNQVGPHGEVRGYELAPNASVDLVALVRVRIDCPGPYPVALHVTLRIHRQPVTITLPAFNDLGGVRYSGCAGAS